MARKHNKLTEDTKELAELLDAVSTLLDRTKVLYEQYFMGIQKMPPAQLHRDIERKIRELTQRQIRNTALRYRLTNVTQKYGVYNTYWRRILRQIDQGTYIRDVARVHRRARRKGQDVPDEIIGAMPKRMRDRVLRDRELLAKRHRTGTDATDLPESAHKVRSAPVHVHHVDDNLLDSDDIDLDAAFGNIMDEAVQAVTAKAEAPAAARPATTGPGSAENPPAEQPSQRPSPPIPAPATSPTPVPLGARSRPSTVPPPIPAPATSPTPVPLGARSRPSTVPPPMPKAAPPMPKAAPPMPNASVPPRRYGRPASVPPPIPGANQPRRVQPKAAAGPRSPRPSNPLPGMTEESTRALYKRYLKARKQVGKSTDIPYEVLVQSLRNQAPAMMKQHKAKAVEFDVEVKGDKVILKATPKR